MTIIWHGNIKTWVLGEFAFSIMLKQLYNPKCHFVWVSKWASKWVSGYVSSTKVEINLYMLALAYSHL